MTIAYSQFQKILRRIDEGVPERIRFEQQRGVLPVCDPAHLQDQAVISR